MIGTVGPTQRIVEMPTVNADGCNGDERKRDDVLNEFWAWRVRESFRRTLWNRNRRRSTRDGSSRLRG